MKGLPVSLKAKEYPQKNHCNRCELLTTSCRTSVYVLAYLEGHDCQCRHTEEDHRERIFTPEEAGVEESETRDHNPYQRRTDENKGDITRVVDSDWVSPLWSGGVIPCDGAGYTDCNQPRDPLNGNIVFQNDSHLSYSISRAMAV